VFLLRAIGQFADTAMRTDDISESVKLGRLRTRCKREGSKHGLHDEEPGSGERYRKTPSSVATVHVQSRPLSDNTYHGSDHRQADKLPPLSFTWR
jgi:hypothetical protein